MNWKDSIKKEEIDVGSLMPKESGKSKARRRRMEELERVLDMIEDAYSMDFSSVQHKKFVEVLENVLVKLPSK